MHVVRELVCAAVVSTPSIHSWIILPRQRDRFEYPLFVLPPGHEEERKFLISGEGTLDDRLPRWIALKRLPTTYAVLPDDALGAAKAFKRDIFVIFPAPGGEECSAESQIT
jgi:hypothetical protein